MMYLNSDLQPGPHLRTLIAHEYTHAITFSEHVFGPYSADNQVGQEEENWLDESIAHIAENQHGFSWSNLDYRISGFLNAPERYRLVVPDYYAAELWRGHGNRGSTYLFLRWCVDQFGEEILRDLVQTNLTGIRNVETTTAVPFSELYRAWSAALFLSHTGLATRPNEELRHLALRGVVGARFLAGPRFEYLDVTGEVRQFSLAGTSTKYLVAHSTAGLGARVAVQASPDCDLQISVRRLPHQMARMTMKASRIESSETTPGLNQYLVELSECNGVPVTLEWVGWERVAPGSNKEADRSACGKAVPGAEIARLFGSTRLEAGGSLTAPDLTVNSPPWSDQKLVLKVMGRDAAGHVVSAWCDLELAVPAGAGSLRAASE
jgi:hypothetical protein